MRKPIGRTALARTSRQSTMIIDGVPLLRRSSAGRRSSHRHCFCEAVAHSGEKLGLLPGRAFAAALVISAMAATARALINQHYTPVDLVNQSETILKVDVGPLDEDGLLTVKLVKTLSGEAPGRLSLQAETIDGDLMDNLEFALGEDKKASALLFLGDFSAAADDPILEGGAPVGALQIGTTWFALSKGSGGKLRVGGDPLDLMTVWAGGDAMLERLVEYVLNDYTADVPTKAGVVWGGDLKLADVGGQVNGCMAVDLASDGRQCLFILADGGDRLFRPSGNAGRLLDAGAELGLDTCSKKAAWGDFNGDGRLDLASWDGRQIVLRLMGPQAKFQSAVVEIKVSGECVGLTALDVADGGRAGLLVSTADRPVVVILDADSKATVRALPGPGGASLGTAGPCVAADFTGDGLVDVAQPRAEGLLLYRRDSAGRFAAPAAACEVGGGAGLTTALSGDYDADGLLDLVVAGKEGCFVYRNLGDGRFGEVLEETGEVVYISKPNAIGGTSCDLNNDGRQEFVLLYANMGAQFYFNRGFCCFGYATDLELSQSDLPAAQIAMQGQQAAAVADFNADGAQDLVVVAADGQVWLLWRDVRQGPKLGVTVALSRQTPGPVNVIGYDGKRCLGARAVAAGAPVLFGRRTPGPISLRWRAGGEPRTEVVDVAAPVRFQLPQSKATR